MKEEIESAEAVSRALDRIHRIGNKAEFELSNGIVLSIKTVPPFLIQAVQNEFHMPDPPKVMIEEKGREEENPNDPTYLREIERLSEAQINASHDLYLAVGTSAKSVPEGYYMPEQDEWIAQVEFAASIVGHTLQIDRDDKIKRYLHWLKLYALESNNDITLVTILPSQLAGVREGEVDEVVESFRSLPERGPDPERPVEAGSSNGNTANRATRRSRV